MKADSVVPNGVDVDKYHLEKRRRNNKILFIGDFKWIQNIDAMDWILDKVWSEFLKQFKSKPSPLLWVVGRNIPASLKNRKTNSVFFDENAPSETEKIYYDSNVLLAPIRVGGGTSFKILEAMASGLPVITTSLGNQGIMAKPGQDLIIANNPKDFSKAIIELLTNSKKYDEVSEKASEFIQKNYDWKNIVLKLEKVYKQIS
jgi:glycosyltransferase involved in cell wall biosynthesis